MNGMYFVVMIVKKEKKEKKEVFDENQDEFLF